MATYYVRKNGNDSNSAAQAQNPATAWLTIDKAANNVAAGDTVYVGAGTYRESVTMDTSGSSGNVIKFIADVTGEQTGDAGLVVISAFTNSTTATRSSCWDPDGRTFVEVYDFVMQGGTTGVVYSANTTNDNYEGVVFDGCAFISGPSPADYGIFVDMNQATAPSTVGLTITHCVFRGSGVVVRWDQNATAEVNLKVEISDSVFIGDSYTNFNGSALFWDLSGSSTYGSGGASFYNNTVFGFAYAVYVDHGTSTTYPVAVRNCYLVAGTTVNKATSNDGALTSDYSTHRGSQANVTLGSNDTDDSTTTLFGGGLADLPLWRKWGWSPYLPWEPMRPPGDDDWTSLIGTASASFAPADDLYGHPRPMHGTADDRGAVEGRARLEVETTTVRTGSTAGRFDGAGRHAFTIPVAASSTTVSVYARKDANYTGTAPQLKVSRIPGVADQTDTHTAAANTWEELTVTFTPTSAGVAVVELISNDTSATGTSYFDDLTVT